MGVNFYIFKTVMAALGPTHPPIQWVPGWRVKFTTYLQVKSEWKYTSTPHLRLYGVDRENFIFCLLSEKKENVW
jgi:hypothetical protein